MSELSANDAMVDPDSWEMTLIDFEAAIRLGKDEHLVPIHSRWTTPGFTRSERLERGEVHFLDDYYAASRVLLGALCDLNPDCHDWFMEFLLEMGTRSGVTEVIRALEGGEIPTAPSALSSA